jgi:ATP-dependent Lon protease
MPNPPLLYPILPLRDIVVFPQMIVPLFVGRDKSVTALEQAMRESKHILLLTQKTAAEDDPKPNDLFSVGTVGNVLQLLKLPDGTVKVLVEGLRRAEVVEYKITDGFYAGHAHILDNARDDKGDINALCRAVLSQFEQYIKLNKKIAPEVLTAVNQIDDAGRLADTIASHLALKIADKQDLLETLSVYSRLEKAFGYMEGEIGALQVEKRIRTRVKKQMEKNQRDYYLNEQMKAIQKELHENEEGKDELSQLEASLKKLHLTPEAKEKVASELKKLRAMSPMSAEATVGRNYLDWIATLPWKKNSKLKHDIHAAENILNQDHYALEKVKERILEYLAVQVRAKNLKSPILCLVGPPGVGKTSLGKSIARATGRNFVRLSFGGVRDESEIRGHRRTYIGSMPGKIINSMKKAKASNPLLLIDEIDKLGQDFRGDPASALLEVLDPEQNKTFNDHYLELDYDLSQVMFVCTANTLNMPQPLLDRMEVIRLAGYTEEEKVEIAKTHLIQRQQADHGLRKDEWFITDAALRDVIRYYTREAGVRNLERELAKLTRKATKEILSNPDVKTITVTPELVEKYLGVKKFRYGVAEIKDLIGVVTGLAWTEVGGELLSIEAVSMIGKGKVTTTGKLGDVMQESISAATSFIRSQCVHYGIKPSVFETQDIHVHVPEGATPKDGPSAGVAMCTAIVSALTGIAIRRDIAMTGEITLRGRVLPIGGLKEKLLAALCGGIKTVFIPQENVKDLAEIPANVKEGLEIIAVSHVNEVLEKALTSRLIPIEWEIEVESKGAAPILLPLGDGSGIRH